MSIFMYAYIIYIQIYRPRPRSTRHARLLERSARFEERRLVMLGALTFGDCCHAGQGKLTFGNLFQGSNVAGPRSGSGNFPDFE